MDFESWKDSPAGKSITKQIKKSINDIELEDYQKTYIKEIDFIDDNIEEILYNVYDRLMDGIDDLQVNIEEFVSNIDEESEE